MQLRDGCCYLFTCSDKTELLRWIQATSSAAALDTSPFLLQASGGVVLQASFLDCQEFALQSSSSDQPNPLLHRRLAGQVGGAGSYAAVDYGKLWVVLRGCGLLQCVEAGQPDTLLRLTDCCRVKVQNPQELREGSEYSIELEMQASRLVLRAESASEHGDWVLAMERVLQQLGLREKMRGHRNRESSYVTLKRLLGEAGPKTYSLPCCLDDTKDLYEAPAVPSGLRKAVLEEHDPMPSSNTVPLPPRDYLPPPLPPRDDQPPPLPPRARPPTKPRPPRPDSDVSSDSLEMDEDYILMLPSSGPSPSHPPHLTSTTKQPTLHQNAEPPGHTGSPPASTSEASGPHPLTSGSAHTPPHACNGGLPGHPVSRAESLGQTTGSSNGHSPDHLDLSQLPVSWGGVKG